MKVSKRVMKLGNLEQVINFSQKSRMKFQKFHRRTKKICRSSLQSIKLKVKMVMGKNPNTRSNWGASIQKLKMAGKYLYRRKNLSAFNQKLVKMGMVMESSLLAQLK